MAERDRSSGSGQTRNVMHTNRASNRSSLNPIPTDEHEVASETDRGDFNTKLPDDGRAPGNQGGK